MDLKKIPLILEQYKGLYKNAEDELKLEGKTLEQANMEHSSIYLYYYDKLCELKKIMGLIDIEINKLIGTHYIKYNENHSRALTAPMISKYVEQEVDIINARLCKAEVEEIKNKFEAVKEAFLARGFILNNITKARVAQVEQGLL